LTPFLPNDTKSGFITPLYQGQGGQGGQGGLLKRGESVGKKEVFEADFG
jgi:hypothetical protein